MYNIIRCMDVFNTHDDAHGLLLVKWLEEILYMDEVEEKWLVDCSVKLEDASDGIQLQAQVRYINSNDVEKEVEIKAVNVKTSLSTKLL